MFSVKQQHSDFIVTEHLRMPTQKTGSAAFPYFCVCLEKRSLNTKELIADLAKLLKVTPYLIGFAGLKDKLAVCYQRVSFGPAILGKTKGDKSIKHTLLANNYVIIDTCWIEKSLSPKSAVVNEFSIMLHSEQTYTPDQCKRWKDVLEKEGFINVYGEQRFGRTTHNHRQGKKILTDQKSGNRKESFDDTFKAQAFASYVFNECALQRRRDGNIPLEGDILDEEGHCTAPVVGADLTLPDEETSAGSRERRAIRSLGVNHEVLAGFDRFGLWGRRRAILAYPEIKHFGPRKNGYVLRCILPKGSYLTALVSHLNDHILTNPSMMLSPGSQQKQPFRPDRSYADSSFEDRQGKQSPSFISSSDDSMVFSRPPRPPRPQRSSDNDRQSSRPDRPSSGSDRGSSSRPSQTRSSEGRSSAGRFASNRGGQSSDGGLQSSRSVSSNGGRFGAAASSPRPSSYSSRGGDRGGSEGAYTPNPRHSSGGNNDRGGGRNHEPSDSRGSQRQGGKSGERSHHAGGGFRGTGNTPSSRSFDRPPRAKDGDDTTPKKRSSFVVVRDKKPSSYGKAESREYQGRKLGGGGGGSSDEQRSTRPARPRSGSAYGASRPSGPSRGGSDRSSPGGDRGGSRGSKTQGPKKGGFSRSS